VKARTVIVTLEIGTELSLSALRASEVWNNPQAKASVWNVEGVSVRVAQPVKAKAKAGKRKAKRKR
jgi:hypothetical protein